MNLVFSRLAQGSQSRLSEPLRKAPKKVNLSWAISFPVAEVRTSRLMRFLSDAAIEDWWKVRVDCLAVVLVSWGCQRIVQLFLPWQQWMNVFKCVALSPRTILPPIDCKVRSNFPVVHDQGLENGGVTLKLPPTLSLVVPVHRPPPPQKKQVCF